MVKVNIVIETIIDNRTDRHFGVWPQLFDGMAQQVRAGVTNDLQTFFIFCGDDGQCRIVFDQIGGIHQLTVDTAGDGRFRETRPMSVATSIGLTARSKWRWLPSGRVITGILYPYLQ